MIVKGDLIRDSGLSTVNGIKTIRRVYNVNSMPINDVNILTMAEMAGGIPRYGDSHPIYNYCIVRRVDVSPLAQSGNVHATACEVVVTYEGNDSVSVQFGSTLQQVMTDTNNVGKEIVVYFSGNVDQNDDQIAQRAVVPKFCRNDSIVFTHWYVVKNRDLTYPTPIEKLKEKYLGKVNKVTYRGRPRYCWMCVQFDGNTIDFGRSYEVTVKLERRAASIDPALKTEDGWAEYAWYHNFNGEVPHACSKKLRDGVHKVDDLYDEVDFNDIGNDLLNIGSL